MSATVVAFPLKKSRPGILIQSMDYDELDDRLMRLAVKWFAFRERGLLDFVSISSAAHDRIIIVGFDSKGCEARVLFEGEKLEGSDPSHFLLTQLLQSDELSDIPRALTLSNFSRSVSVQCFYIPFRNSDQKLGALVY